MTLPCPPKTRSHEKITGPACCTEPNGYRLCSLQLARRGGLSDRVCCGLLEVLKYENPQKRPEPWGPQAHSSTLCPFLLHVWFLMPMFFQVVLCPTNMKTPSRTENKCCFLGFCVVRDVRAHCFSEIYKPCFRNCQWRPTKSSPRTATSCHLVRVLHAFRLLYDASCARTHSFRLHMPERRGWGSLIHHILPLPRRIRPLLRQ